MRPPPPTAQEVRATLQASQQSTQQNRRLAQQMANRPAVQAALGIPQQQQRQKKPKKSLKQRLGPSNVKARLSLGNAPMQGRSRGGRRGGFRGGRGQMNGSMRGKDKALTSQPIEKLLGFKCYWFCHSEKYLLFYSINTSN